MNLSRNLLRSVLFVGRDEGGSFEPKGTAFLVQLDGTSYLVTARHVAEQLGGGKFQIRINRLEEGADVVTINVPNLAAPWRFFAQDPSVDLAALHFDCLLNGQLYEVANIPENMFASEDQLNQWGIGLGETCYAVGLFGRAPGRVRNMPVVHTGNIAAAPEGKNINIQGRDGIVMTDAYLVTASNLSGLSGAPVFVRPSVLLEGQVVNGKRLMAHAESVYLLGVWQASWTEEAGGRGARVPVGMGVVVPVSRLIELLRSDLLTEERANADAALKDRLARFASPTEFFADLPGITARQA